MRDTSFYAARLHKRVDAIIPICSSGMRILHRKSQRLFVPLTTPRSEDTTYLKWYNAQNPTLLVNLLMQKPVASTVAFCLTP